MIYTRKRTDTHNRILNAAIELLAEIGYDNLTITRIAETADVGRGTVYQYFGDKEGLVLQIFQRYYEQIEDEANLRMLEYESPLREIIAWQTTFEHLARIKPIFRQINSPGAQILWQRFENYAQQHFRVSLERGLFLYPQWMNLPADVMATFTSGAVLSVMRRWLSEELSYDPPELARMVHQLLYHAPDRRA